MFKKSAVVLLFALPLLTLNSFARQTADTSAVSQIRIDQIGYYPNATKIAIVLDDIGNSFMLQTIAKKTVFKAKLKRSALPDLAGKYTRTADFTEFTKTGKYVLYVPSVGYSYPFSIQHSVHRKVAEATVKAFYYMRASIPLQAKYAGKWARAEGHPDTSVLIHSSAADRLRPEGMHISAPRGWYDAGDYNKYVVNSGISTYTLLSLYEDFPGYVKEVKLNIPESGNHIPDLLNEILWNLRWMLTMQDPNDGGVYHKLTNAAFDKMEMPEKATDIRYVVQKSTAATLDFAAVMAQASRVFKAYPKQLPHLADSCLKASVRAWEWAQKNPRAIYNKFVMNDRFSPKVTTGDYGDNNVSDEFMWAASELFVTTHDSKYTRNINLLPNEQMPLPSWSQVRLLGYYSILHYSAQLQGFSLAAQLKPRFIAFVDDMVKGVDQTAYRSAMYKSSKNFVWGSNSVAANQGIAMIQAYLLTHKRTYLLNALSNLDYILGRNGTGYSFVTGYGSKTPVHPHHRPSVADGITDPVPGLMAGGANPGMQDHIRPLSLVPDQAYIDDDEAYAVNEVAINWNAPMAYLANAVEALQKQL